MLHKSCAALAVCLALSACATPENVPSNANVGFDPLTNSGRTYTWRHTVDGGCANFRASDGSQSVRLIVDPTKCHGAIRADASCNDECGPGLLYLTDNYIVVQGFWSGNVSSAVPGGDSELLGGCPNLTPEQLTALRHVAQGAAVEARTDAERTTLTRIDQVLAASGRAPLRSGQFGCMLESQQRN